MARITGGVSQIISFPQASSFTAEVVAVVTAGTPVQLPNIPIPDGFTVSIRSYRGNTLGSRIYLANSSANTADTTKRIELRLGEGVEFLIDNVNKIWIDSSVSGSKVEVLVEQ